MMVAETAGWKVAKRAAWTGARKVVKSVDELAAETAVQSAESWAA